MGPHTWTVFWEYRQLGFEFKGWRLAKIKQRRGSEKKEEKKEEKKQTAKLGFIDDNHSSLGDSLWSIMPLGIVGWNACWKGSVMYPGRWCLFFLFEYLILNYRKHVKTILCARVYIDLKEIYIRCVTFFRRTGFFSKEIYTRKVFR